MKNLFAALSYLTILQGILGAMVILFDEAESKECKNFINISGKNFSANEVSDFTTKMWYLVDSKILSFL